MSSVHCLIPVESIDSFPTELAGGTPLSVALVLAALLGLRHACDPDHLVAVTSLVAVNDGRSRAAVKLGFWWGIGHALCLLAIGLPLIAVKSMVPAWLSHGAEVAVGLVIVALATRVILKWMRGGYRVGSHRHSAYEDVEAGSHSHVRRGSGSAHDHLYVRTRLQAFALGLLHGVAGTGGIVLILIAALPGQVEAAAALAVFVPMSILSMTVLTGVFAWLLTRPLIEPVYRRLLIPGIGSLGLIFGLSHSGLA